MSNDGVNAGRRRFLVAATSVVGAAGAVGAAVPFVGSWFPSAKAKAAGAPVKVNIAKVEAGQQMVAEWRGQPVFIVRRTDEILGNLKKVVGDLADPESKASVQPTYVDPQVRSIKPEILILVGLCTHLAARPPSARKSHPPTLARNGSVAISARATVPTTTWPAVSTSRSRRHSTCPCHRTLTSRTRSSSSALTRRTHDEQVHGLD
ncbi:ubiquinol-cytochrome c reductase iron-sulfur subunit [Pseudomonas taiwanensis]|uniref:ubiquinol-cytochrome c reductase iron-sulfur subunit n=1 Tax=Pseudomonas taiwanensis TaxID=470150 RepID=UPI0004266A04